ncbi:D-alanyl-D-alanine carboxypeptidase family protein [Luedemannella helvata]|uniref:Peptidase S11 D-alanyl-D-alanine carboxypeptidase A N-terminal domain-containing protein n=1 Tax=Luedemannella helvata TaxID=349315 RepID=A0ABP4WM23_9ACTN
MSPSRTAAALLLSVAAVAVSAPAHAHVHAPVESCLTSKLVSPRPKPSPLPTRDPAQPVIGGAALAAPGLVVPADATDLPKKVTARSWLVADVDTGEVLGACGAHEYGAPASVQKLLLAATLMDKLDAKQKVKVTNADLQYEPGSSAVGLVSGGSYTVRTLWLGLLLNSGNDAANVLARVGGGAAGVRGTMGEMNGLARKIGAWDTKAVTPSGLDGRGQVTSAYDLALIARICFANKDFLAYAQTPTTMIPAQKPRYAAFQIQNDVSFTFAYQGALGGKTGFTDFARHTFVGAAQRNGKRLVVAVLGAENRPAKAWQQGAALLDWGFETVGSEPVGKLVSPDEVAALAVPAAAAASATPAAPPTPKPAPVALPRTSGVNWLPPWAVLVLVGVGIAVFTTIGIVQSRKNKRRRRRR